jgi:tetratricopeptide (TPR) repeat protein
MQPSQCACGQRPIAGKPPKPVKQRLFFELTVARGFSPYLQRVLSLRAMRQTSPGKVIIAGPHSKTVAFVAFLALTTFGALAAASAQPADIKAIDKAFQDHYARENYPAAQIDAQELERLVKARFGADHAYYAVALNKLGIVFQAQDKYTDAEGLFKRALAIREKALGANHADVGQSLNNLAYAYHAQSKYSEAEALYKRALPIREKALGANHPDVGQTLSNLANLYRDQGKYGEAEDLLKRALVIREQDWAAVLQRLLLPLSCLTLPCCGSGSPQPGPGLLEKAMVHMTQAAGQRLRPIIASCPP